jgi:tetratricopeptide (TPR) repeat protein
MGMSMKSIKFTLTALFLCGALLLTGAKPTQHWLLDAADRALAARDPSNEDIERAITTLWAYQLIANKPDVWLRIGDLLEKRNRITETIDALERYRSSASAELSTAAAEQLDARIQELIRREDERSIRESLHESARLTEYAERAFREGRQLILERNYDEGIGYLQAAAYLDPSLPGPYRLLGATYLKLGRSEKAKQHLAAYLRIRPDGKLADKVRKMLAKQNVLGRLDTDASFPCDVWVNGRYMGKATPLKNVLLPQGYHILAFVSEAHHLVKTFRIKIEANQAILVNFRYGVVRVHLEPWGRIRANGRDLGLWEELGLPTGEYQLNVTSHDGKKRGSTLWTVKAGEVRSLTWKELS